MLSSFRYDGDIRGGHGSADRERNRSSEVQLMIQARGVESLVEQHRQELISSGRIQCDHADPVSSKQSAQRDAALGRRPPGYRWPSGAPGCRPAFRRLAHRLRHEARRSDGSHLELRRGLDRGRSACVRRCEAGSTAWHRQEWRACPRHRNVLFITLDQWRGDCLSALDHPVLETPALDALAVAGRAVRQPLGQRRTVRTVAGVPLHGHVSAPEPLDPERHPARRTVHQRRAWWRGSSATTRCSSGTRTPRSTRGRCRPTTPGCTPTKASSRASVP